MRKTKFSPMTIISSDHENEIQFFRNHLPCPRILKMIRRNKWFNPLYRGVSERRFLPLNYVLRCNYLHHATKSKNPKHTVDNIIKLRMHLLLYLLLLKILKSSSYVEGFHWLFICVCFLPSLPDFSKPFPKDILNYMLIYFELYALIFIYFETIKKLQFINNIFYDNNTKPFISANL